jgi:hypothetical protein
VNEGLYGLLLTLKGLIPPVSSTLLLPHCSESSIAAMSRITAASALPYPLVSPTDWSISSSSLPFYPSPV